MVGARPNKEPRPEAQLKSSTAKAGATTPGLTPSPPPKCIPLAPSTLEKPKQRCGHRAPFPGAAVPDSGAGPFDATLCFPVSIGHEAPRLQNQGPAARRAGRFPGSCSSSSPPPTQSCGERPRPGLELEGQGCPLCLGCTDPARDLGDVTPRGSRLSPVSWGRSWRVSPRC